MLGDNIRAARESKGLSQEDLAERLHVVRQTVSKWERALSVPDADMLVRVADELGTPVSALLGAGPVPSDPAPAEGSDVLRDLAERLEAINRELARRAVVRRRALLGVLGAVFVLTAAGLVCLAALGGGYLAWDLTDPETAVAATGLHALEWVFVRAAPFLLCASAAGIVLARRRG